MEDGRSYTDHLSNFAAGPLDEFHLVSYLGPQRSTLSKADAVPVAHPYMGRMIKTETSLDFKINSPKSIQ